MFTDCESKQKLAYMLVNYSCGVKSGEKVLIEATDIATDFIEMLIDEIWKVGAYPFVWNRSIILQKALIKNANKEYAELNKKYDLPIMQDMDAVIILKACNNKFEFKDVDASVKKIYDLHYTEPVEMKERVNNTKWVLLAYPTSAFAQSANMSTEEFAKFYYKVCTLDYAKMSKAMDKLVQYMEKTNKVRIVGVDTDLEFSISGQKAIKCDGKMNIPDGEVYTSPLRTSVNGKIKYNIASLYNGIKFENVYFEIKNGKIVKADAGAQTEELNSILNTDEGARYFGEFALGVNPYITVPMLDILFDEKICGSFHLTPGSCYDDASNGNNSAIHWDLVMCQNENYGGGKIFFDDVLIRENGKFVVDELLDLNPENLI